MNPLALLGAPRGSRLMAKVAHRNADVFLISWKSDFLPPLLEPLLYLGAIGFGLGLFVEDIEGIPYVAWFGPALIPMMAMNTSFFECAFGSYVRMVIQKTYDAIVATPLSLDDVVLGELLWGATKATLNSAIVLVVVIAFGLVQSPLILLSLPVVFLAALSFGSIGLLTSSLAPSFDAFNFPMYLYITPMFFLSGTFIPLSLFDPFPVAKFIAYTLPLTHAVLVTRSLSAGVLGPTELASFAWLVVVGAALSIISVNSMKQRLIR